MVLPLVPTPDEQLDRPPQGMHSLREAARPPRQACEVMPQFGVITFDRVGLTLVVHRVVLAPPDPCSFCEVPLSSRLVWNINGKASATMSYVRIDTEKDFLSTRSTTDSF